MSDDDLEAIRSRLAGEVGPRPWRDGDARAHCTHCAGCGLLFRTDEINAHRLACWSAYGNTGLAALLAEVYRLRRALHASEVLLAEVRAQRDALTAPAAEEF